MGNFINIQGRRFGKLVVIERSNKKANCAIWKCKCDCGNEKEIMSTSLRNGCTKSCGCGMKKTMFQVKHGKSFSLEYHSWMAMRSRAKAREKRYIQYIAKGISEKWLNSFDEFYKDMGPIPSDSHTIERIDNTKGYFPENCKWALQKEQNRNYSQNRFLTHNGKTMCATEWAEFYNVNRHAIYRRLRRGFTNDQIFKYLEQL